jgi:hypothetical protein
MKSVGVWTALRGGHDLWVGEWVTVQRKGEQQSSQRFSADLVITGCRTKKSKGTSGGDGSVGRGPSAVFPLVEETDLAACGPSLEEVWAGGKASEVEDVLGALFTPEHA